MKSKVLAAMVAVALAMLCGCSQLVYREYQSVEPYFESPVTTAEGDYAPLQVGNYAELVNTILYFVSSGLDEGQVELVDYTGDVESELNRACAEVVQEDPLGAYWVEGIGYEYSRTGTIYEVILDVQYRDDVDREETISMVVGENSVRRALENSLFDFSTQLLLRVTYFEQDEAYVQEMVSQIYYTTPQLAYGLPQVAVTFYPEEGSERIAQIDITYPLTPEVQEERVAELTQTVAAYVDYLSPLEGAEQWDALVEQLSLGVGVLEDDSLIQGDTPWNVLVQGVGDDQGLALTIALLCDQLAISCEVVVGSYQGEDAYWNYFPDGVGGVTEPCYLDMSRQEEIALYDGVSLALLDYLWVDGYPDMTVIEIDLMDEDDLDMSFVQASIEDRLITGLGAQ